MRHRPSHWLALTALALFFCISGKSAHAMTVSPPTLDFTLNPGDVVADVIQVYNEEGVPFKITPISVNFYQKADDEVSGSPEFYDKDVVRNGYELAPWFEFNPTPVVIPPNERINIPFQIRVPENAQPGSHFGAIQITAAKPDEIQPLKGSSLSFERGTTVLIFVRVGGDAKDDLKVMDFKPQSGFLTHLPADFTIRLSNEGNTHLRPVGNVIIENAFGRQVAAVSVNPGPQYKSVLPGSSRRFDVSWFRHRIADGTNEYWQQLRNFAFGPYTATLLLNYGATKQMKNLTAVTTFWVVPWMALLTILAVLIILGLIVYSVFRGYNKALIRRYESHKPR